MMLDSHRSQRPPVELIDSDSIVADLKELAATHAGRERELRTAVAQRLKSALTQARAQAEELLLKDRHGRRCAERLCFVQDEIIRILFAAATRHLYHSPIPSGADVTLADLTGAVSTSSFDTDLTSIANADYTLAGGDLEGYLTSLSGDTSGLSDLSTVLTDFSSSFSDLSNLSTDFSTLLTDLGSLF